MLQQILSFMEITLKYDLYILIIQTASLSLFHANKSFKKNHSTPTHQSLWDVYFAVYTVRGVLFIL